MPLFLWYLLRPAINPIQDQPKVIQKSEVNGLQKGSCVSPCYALFRYDLLGSACCDLRRYNSACLVCLPTKCLWGRHRKRTLILLVYDTNTTTKQIKVTTSARSVCFCQSGIMSLLFVLISLIAGSQKR